MAGFVVAADMSINGFVVTHKEGSPPKRFLAYKINYSTVHLYSTRIVTSLEKWQVRYASRDSRTGDMKAKKHDQRGKMTDAKIHKVFDDMVKSRKLRRAAHFVTQRVMMILMKNQASQFQKYFIPTTSSSKDT